jgi:hypothetical protein
VDDVSIVEDYSTDDASEHSPVADLSALLGNRRQSALSQKSSRSSLRRQSLDTIQYLAEKEPQTLAKRLLPLYGEPLDHQATDTLSESDTDDNGSATDDVQLGRLSFYSVQSRGSMLSGTASSRNSGFVPEETREELISPVTPNFTRRSGSLTRSNSNGRQIKQGMKLMQVFGTSEVLTHVLEQVCRPFLMSCEHTEACG